jgi:hypothetical protein
MQSDFDLRLLFLIPFAIFLAIRVGIPLSEARNEAALPLLKSCPSALWMIITMDGAAAFGESWILCSIGAVIIVSIPGAIGIGAKVLR